MIYFGCMRRYGSPSFRLCTFVLVLAFAAGWTTLAWPTLARAVEFPGPQPGKAVARLDGQQLVLQTAALRATWNLNGQRLGPMEVVDRMLDGAVRAKAAEAFVVKLADGRSVKASDLRLSGKPTLERIEPRPKAVGRRHRLAGWKATVPLVAQDGSLRAEWQATIRDQANYVRQRVALQAENKAIAVKELVLLDADAPDAQVLGAVDGSPVVARSLFLACEHPMATSRVEDGRAVCSLLRYGPLRPGDTWTVSAVVGVVPAGQLRRAFLYYVERERPCPYQPFLHYNSWYDIILSPERKMTEAQCLGAIEGFGRELTNKRGVRLDSFVFDDGWDDNRTLWRFDKGFPHGFTTLEQAAAKYKSSLGVWLSPWGGYGVAKKARLEYGKTQGFETNSRGFALAGTKYYGRFRDVCAEMIDKYGANYFKFDGVGFGNDSKGSAGTELAPDIEAMLRLIGDLRRIRPDVFISVTTGTWPSPYWLWHGDSIWRNGQDVGYFGSGTMRQKWITYRDMIVYRMITRRGPLYPINSLMVVGVALGQWSIPTKMQADTGDVVDEIRMLFGSGTNNQELYITPALMTPPMWDALAEAAKWSRGNADVLVDVHWFGGDPGKAEPYAYVSWSPRKGILALRNPGKKPAVLEVDLQKAFELPKDACRRYVLKSPWKQGREPKITLEAGKPHIFKLAPFESLILEALPVE